MGVKISGTNYAAVMEQSKRIESSLIRFEYISAKGAGRWQDSVIRGGFDPI
jgi:hypothetical protein